MVEIWSPAAVEKKTDYHTGLDLERGEVRETEVLLNAHEISTVLRGAGQSQGLMSVELPRSSEAMVKQVPRSPQSHSANCVHTSLQFMQRETNPNPLSLASERRQNEDAVVLLKHHGVDFKTINDFSARLAVLEQTTTEIACRPHICSTSAEQKRAEQILPNPHTPAPTTTITINATGAPLSKNERHLPAIPQHGTALVVQPDPQPSENDGLLVERNSNSNSVRQRLQHHRFQLAAEAAARLLLKPSLSCSTQPHPCRLRNMDPFAKPPSHGPLFTSSIDLPERSFVPSYHIDCSSSMSSGHHQASVRNSQPPRNLRMHHRRMDILKHQTQQHTRPVQAQLIVIQDVQREIVGNNLQQIDGNRVDSSHGCRQNMASQQQSQGKRPFDTTCAQQQLHRSQQPVRSHDVAKKWDYVSSQAHPTMLQPSRKATLGWGGPRADSRSPGRGLGSAHKGTTEV
jgi:hypothetical protein